MTGVTVPTILYHYTSVSGLHSILENSEIWASNIHYLNDSKEFQHAIECTKSVLRKEIDSIGLKYMRDDIIKCVDSRFETIRHLSILVASFSEDGDLLSQWRSYCPPGAGYAIGFDHGKLGLKAKQQHYHLCPCAYAHAEHVALIRPHVLDFLRATAGIKIEVIQNKEPTIERVLGGLIGAFIQVAPMMKHSSFAEEREWRLVSEPFPTNHPTWGVRAGKKMLIPYAPFKTGSGTDSAIREIVVGPTDHQYLAQSSVSSALGKHGIKDWTVRSTNTSYREW